MRIVVQGPTFWEPVDENKFFEWIYSLPDYHSVSGQGLDLFIELNEPVKQDTINQLFILFKRWELDFNSLIPFKAVNKSHISWINDFLE
ncbi:hypothetical protein ACM9HF_02465 [Colwellia sp. RE-S-Sl-9]